MSVLELLAVLSFLEVGFSQVEVAVVRPGIYTQLLRSRGGGGGEAKLPHHYALC